MVPSSNERDPVTRARAQQVALFRYQLICPALEPGLSSKARGRLVREIAAREHTPPVREPRRYSRDTLDRWIRRYRGRRVRRAGARPRGSPVPRTTAQVLELAAALKRENPARTAAQVAADPGGRDAGGRPRSRPCSASSTAWSCTGPAPPGAAVVFGRFEADEPERAVDRRRAARPPDRRAARPTCSPSSTTTPGWSCGYRFGFAEDTVRLAAALRPALAARGVPRAVYVDNGSAFVDCLAAAGLRRSSGSGWSTPPRTARRAGARSNGSSAPCASSSSSRSSTPPPDDLAATGVDAAARCWS